MSLVSIRYAAPGGGLTYRMAEVLGDYGLEHVRVRVLQTGLVRHVHRNSIAWSLA